MPTKNKRVTCTIELPPLDDESAVIIYNGLCKFVDRFDHQYGEQICRYYAQQQRTQNHFPTTSIQDLSPS